MPFLPFANTKSKTRDMVSGFGGYNHNLMIKDNQFYAMQNMSSDLLPVTSKRPARGCVRKLTSPNGLFAHDKLCWVDGTDLYYDNAIVGTVADSPKQFVRMGAYILVFPDKVYYDTVAEEFGALGHSVATTPGATVTAVLCTADGTGYTYTAADTAPAEPNDGDYWIDTSEDTHVLKLYSETYGTWTPVQTVYVMISGTGIGTGFSNADGITISGMSDEALNGEFSIVDCGTDYIIVAAIIDANTTQTTSVTIGRQVPDMDYVCECANRIWGCSNVHHEVYASKLGDPKNFYAFQGISTDSYAVTVGSGGSFTGCISHMGYVMFFKENRIHKIYGTQPSNFTLSDETLRGVALGSEKSIAIVNETLFFLSNGGVCAYGLALPESISENLGPDAYRDGVAGACMNKYYISAKNVAGTYDLLVFDAKKRIWIREDNTQALYMAQLGQDLYYIDDDGYLWSVGGNITDYVEADPGEGEPPYAEPTFTWMLETGDLTINTPDHKYVSGVQMFLSAAAGSTLTVMFQYDGDGVWHTIKTFSMEASKNVLRVPFSTPRCGSMRIKLTGTGDVRVYSLSKIVEQGSDLRG